MQQQKKIGLIRKASRSSLITSLALMALSTVVLFFYIQALLLEEVDEGLQVIAGRIENALRTNGQPIDLPPLIETTRVKAPSREIIRDTLFYDPTEEDIEPFRELTTFRKINGVHYRIKVRSLALDSEDILMAIIFSFFIVILVAFIILYYLNRTRNKKLWRPFFENLEQMKRFSLTSDLPMELVDSDILEFTELNKEISVLTNKVRSDYKNLKQFTEDVSHELQTPLAIIQAKIENIINDNNLNEDQYEQLTSIQKDIKRLTQLNKRLTLLTKIDNKQFANLEQVNISDMIAESIQNFSELSTTAFEVDQPNGITVSMDPYLAEILCTNLLSNAVKHNVLRETIRVVAEGNVLTISNGGGQALKDPEQLFTRFYRETTGATSTGLGLAIAKKICDLYGFQITYCFKEGRHLFSVLF